MLTDIHDSSLVGYSVDSVREEIRFKVAPQSWQAFPPFDIVFSGVKAHQFRWPLLPAILGGLFEQPSQDFLKQEWQEIIAGSQTSAWPGSWSASFETASSFIHAENLTAFRVESSYGLSGWVLAKSASKVTASPPA